MISHSHNTIRILVADDDAQVLRCYRRAFSPKDAAGERRSFEVLSEELFGPVAGRSSQPAFEFVSCRQGQEALDTALDAIERKTPFDVVILDIRMPPGINGVETGEHIRRKDPAVPIVFVSGYSDVSEEDLRRRIPPAEKLHYYRKPVSFSELAREVTEIVNLSRSVNNGQAHSAP